jgi:hypothetical protein
MMKFYWRSSRRLADIGFVLVGSRKAPWTWTFESWRGVPDFLGREDRCKGLMFLCVFLMVHEYVDRMNLNIIDVLLLHKLATV